MFDLSVAGLTIIVLSIAVISLMISITLYSKKNIRLNKSLKELAESPPPQVLHSPTEEQPKIIGVVFDVFRLPYLKNLLFRYEKEHKQHYDRKCLEDKALKVLKPLTDSMFAWFRHEAHFTSESTVIQNEPTGNIILSHAVEIQKFLDLARSNGWDGIARKTADDFAYNYRCDAILRLRQLVYALEAGNNQATLAVPARLQGEYETWFISSLAYGATEGLGPAAPLKESEMS